MKNGPQIYPIAEKFNAIPSKRILLEATIITINMLKDTYSYGLGAKYC